MSNVPASFIPDPTPDEVKAELQRAAQRYGVDPNLVMRIARQESGFRADLASSKNALGIMQLLPSTAKDLGVDPADWRQNIDGGVRYLRQMLNRYQGDVQKALAAYNSGMKNVDQYGGVPPFEETRKYVRAITGTPATFIPDEGSEPTTTKAPAPGYRAPKSFSLDETFQAPAADGLSEGVESGSNPPEPFAGRIPSADEIESASIRISTLKTVLQSQAEELRKRQQELAKEAQRLSSVGATPEQLQDFQRRVMLHDADRMQLEHGLKSLEEQVKDYNAGVAAFQENLKRYENLTVPPGAEKTGLPSVPMQVREPSRTVPAQVKIGRGGAEYGYVPPEDVPRGEFRDYMTGVFTGKIVDEALAPKPTDTTAESIAKGVVKVGLGLVSPQALATMLAAGGLTGALRAAVNSPKVANALSQLPNFTGIMKATEVAAETAVPAAFTALAGKGAVEGALATKSAFEKGETPAATQYTVETIANAILAALGAAGTAKAYLRTTEAYPVGPIPESGAARTRRLETGVQEGSALMQSGRTMAAKAWLEQARRIAEEDWAKVFSEPVRLQLGQKAVRVEFSGATQPTASRMRGRPIFQVVDESTGAILTRGEPSSIAQYLEQRGAKRSAAPKEADIASKIAELEDELAEARAAVESRNWIRTASEQELLKEKDLLERFLARVREVKSSGQSLKDEATVFSAQQDLELISRRLAGKDVPPDTVGEQYVKELESEINRLRSKPDATQGGGTPPQASGTEPAKAPGTEPMPEPGKVYQGRAGEVKVVEVKDGHVRFERTIGKTTVIGTMPLDSFQRSFMRPPETGQTPASTTQTQQQQPETGTPTNETPQAQSSTAPSEPESTEPPTTPEGRIADHKNPQPGDVFEIPGTGRFHITSVDSERVYYDFYPQDKNNKVNRGLSLDRSTFANYKRIRPVLFQSTQATTAGAAQSPEGEIKARLPRDLAGAIPRYNYGSKSFELQFESDLDRAAYIAAQSKPSKRDADYVRFVSEATGMSEDEVRAYGRRVRDAIKALAKDSEPGKLLIPADISGQFLRPTAQTPVGATQTQPAPQEGPAAQSTEPATAVQSQTTEQTGAPSQAESPTVQSALPEPQPGQVYEDDSGSVKIVEVRDGRVVYEDARGSGNRWTRGLEAFLKTFRGPILPAPSGPQASSSAAPTAPVTPVPPVQPTATTEPAQTGQPTETTKTPASFIPDEPQQAAETQAAETTEQQAGTTLVQPSAPPSQPESKTTETPVQTERISTPATFVPDQRIASGAESPSPARGASTNRRIEDLKAKINILEGANVRLLTAFADKDHPAIVENNQSISEARKELERLQSEGAAPQEPTRAESPLSELERQIVELESDLKDASARYEQADEYTVAREEALRDMYEISTKLDALRQEASRFNPLLVEQEGAHPYLGLPELPRGKDSFYDSMMAEVPDLAYAASESYGYEYEKWLKGGKSGSPPKIPSGTEVVQREFAEYPEKWRKAAARRFDNWFLEDARNFLQDLYREGDISELPPELFPEEAASKPQPTPAEQLPAQPEGAGLQEPEPQAAETTEQQAGAAPVQPSEPESKSPAATAEQPSPLAQMTPAAAQTTIVPQQPPVTPQAPPTEVRLRPFAGAAESVMAQRPFSRTTPPGGTPERQAMVEGLENARKDYEQKVGALNELYRDLNKTSPRSPLYLGIEDKISKQARVVDAAKEELEAKERSVSLALLEDAAEASGSPFHKILGHLHRFGADLTQDQRNVLLRAAEEEVRRLMAQVNTGGLRYDAELTTEQRERSIRAAAHNVVARAHENPAVAAKPLTPEDLATEIDRQQGEIFAEKVKDQIREIARELREAGIDGADEISKLVDFVLPGEDHRGSLENARTRAKELREKHEQREREKAEQQKSLIESLKPLSEVPKGTWKDWGGTASAPGRLITDGVFIFDREAVKTKIPDSVLKRQEGKREVSQEDARKLWTQVVGSAGQELVPLGAIADPERSYSDFAFFATPDGAKLYPVPLRLVKLAFDKIGATSARSALHRYPGKSRTADAIVFYKGDVPLALCLTARTDIYFDPKLAMERLGIPVAPQQASDAHAVDEILSQYSVVRSTPSAGAERREQLEQKLKEARQKYEEALRVEQALTQELRKEGSIEKRKLIEGRLEKAENDVTETKINFNQLNVESLVAAIEDAAEQHQDRLARLSAFLNLFGELIESKEHQWKAISSELEKEALQYLWSIATAFDPHLTDEQRKQSRQEAARTLVRTVGHDHEAAADPRSALKGLLDRNQRSYIERWVKEQVQQIKESLWEEHGIVLPEIEEFQLNPDVNPLEEFEKIKQRASQKIAELYEAPGTSLFQQPAETRQPEPEPEPEPEPKPSSPPSGAETEAQGQPIAIPNEIRSILLKYPVVRTTPAPGTPQRERLQSQYQKADDTYAGLVDAVALAKRDLGKYPKGSKRYELALGRLKRAEEKQDESFRKLRELQDLLRKAELEDWALQDENPLIKVGSHLWLLGELMLPDDAGELREWVERQAFRLIRAATDDQYAPHLTPEELERSRENAARELASEIMKASPDIATNPVARANRWFALSNRDKLLRKATLEIRGMLERLRRDYGFESQELKDIAEQLRILTIDPIKALEKARSYLDDTIKTLDNQRDAYTLRLRPVPAHESYVSGWPGNLVKPGRFIGDRDRSIDSTALPEEIMAELSKAPAGGTPQIDQNEIEVLFERALSEPKTPLASLGIVDGALAYYAEPGGSVAYAIPARIATLAENVMGADEIRLFEWISTPRVSFFRSGKPVAVASAVQDAPRVNPKLALDRAMGTKTVQAGWSPQWTETVPEELKKNFDGSAWRYFERLLYQARGLLAFIEAFPQHEAEAHWTPGADKLRQENQRRIDAAKQQYVSLLAEAEKNLGREARELLHDQVMRKSPLMPPGDPEAFDDFWNGLRVNDRIAVPNGVIRVTNVESLSLQAVVPGVGSFGLPSRRVTKIAAHVPGEDGAKFFSSSDLKSYLYPGSDVSEADSIPTQPPQPTPAKSESPSRYALSGDTYRHRQQIKKLGGRWIPEEKVWVIPAENLSKAQRLSRKIEIKPYWGKEQAPAEATAAAPEPLPPQAPKEEAENPNHRPEQVLAKAKEILSKLTDSQWTGIRHGMFPAEVMDEARAQGYDMPALTKTLMELASQRKRSALEAEDEENQRLTILVAIGRRGPIEVSELLGLPEMSGMEQIRALDHLYRLEGQGLVKEVEDETYVLTDAGRLMISSGSETTESELPSPSGGFTYEILVNGSWQPSGAVFESKEDAEMAAMSKLSRLRESEDYRIIELNQGAPIDQEIVAELKRKGTAQRGDVSVKIVVHPSVVGAPEAGEAHWAVELTVGGNRQMLKAEPMTFEQAVESAARALAESAGSTITKGDQSHGETQTETDQPGRRPGSDSGSRPQNVRRGSQGQPQTRPAEPDDSKALAGVLSENLSESQEGGVPLQHGAGAGDHDDRAGVQSVEGRTGRGSGAGDSRPGVLASHGQRAVSVDATPTGNIEGDFHLSVEEAVRIETGGAKTKARNNLEAIRIAKQLIQEKRPATPEEQEKLARFVGWGDAELVTGMFTARDRSWDELRGQMYSLLTREEYEAARLSTLNAHYTRRDLAFEMWRLAKRLGFRAGGTVLEPGMGVGNFFMVMPKDLMPGTRRVGVEMDELTGAIAKALFPNSTILIEPFQKTSLPDNYFDLVIGNVPFGKIEIVDPAFRREPFITRNIHNYFLAKSLLKLRPGGVLIAITSRHTMDAKTGKWFRTWMSERAELLGAIRLPRETFQRNAGTSVTTDILVLRKRVPGEAPISSETWIEAPEITTEDGQETFSINEYFYRHPEMMMGVMRPGQQYRRGYPELFGVFSIKHLTDLFEKLPENVIPSWSETSHAEAISEQAYPDAKFIKEGQFAIVNGQVVQKDGLHLRPVVESKQKLERIKGMIEIRGAAREVIRTQLYSDDDAELARAQKELNEVYDRFVKQHGYINAPRNAKAMSEDPDWPFLSALENWDPVNKTATKSDLFSRRTIHKPKPVEKVDTAREALAVSLAETASVNWERMKQLTGKSESELQAELTGLVFKDPLTNNWVTADLYLSGNVRQKLRDAEFAAQKDPYYQVNVDALRKVQPKELKPSEIDAVVGATWIPEDIYSRFLQDTFGASTRESEKLVQQVPILGTFVVAKDIVVWSKAANELEYGTPYFTGIDLFTLALYKRVPVAYDYIRVPTGSGGYRDIRVRNNDATIAAVEKQMKLIERFERWFWEDPERAKVMSELYNELRNNLRFPEFDGSHLTFPGLNRDWLRNGKPDKHQVDGVWRIIQVGNTLLAHSVGSGKTLTIIMAVMELRRLGMARKAMIIVPNHLVAHWAREFLRAYPSAQLLVPDKEDYSPKNRKKLMARIAVGNFDAIIVPMSSFEKLPVKRETYERFMREQLAEIDAAIEELSRGSRDDAELGASASSSSKRRKHGNPTVRRLEKRREQIRARLEKRLKQWEKDDGVTFEELGVDWLFVDEADMYKNLGYISSIRNVAGLPNADANRSNDLLMKARYVMSLHGGRRGLVFATGTPISNTLAEVWTMMRYLMPDYLHQVGFDQFDAWAGTFAQFTAQFEIAPESNRLMSRLRFRSFNNAPELMQMFRLIADVRTKEQLGLPSPPIYQGGPITISVPATEEQKEYIRSLGDRADQIRSGLVEPEEDNMLKLSSDGRKAALDMRLIDPKLPRNPNGKVQRAIENILQIAKEFEQYRATQLVFLDLSIPRADGGDETGAGAEVEAGPEAERFNSVYHDIRNGLIKGGMKPSEVVFIHDFKTKEALNDLYKKMNSGEIRVLIGSRSKMGPGMNVQERLIAVHHLDVPWRPRDLEQADGRIERPGNKLWDEHKIPVRIYRYVTEGTFDAFMWEAVTSKAKPIEMFLKGDTSVRRIEDVSEVVLSYEQAKALASGSPLIRENIILGQEIRKLQLLHAQWMEEIRMAEDQLAQRTAHLKRVREQIPLYREASEEIKNNQTFEWGDHVYSGEDIRGKGIPAMIGYLKSLGPIERGMTLRGRYRGFDLSAEPNSRVFFTIRLHSDSNGLKAGVYHHDKSSGKVYKVKSRRPDGKFTTVNDIIYEQVEDTEAKDKLMKSGGGMTLEEHWPLDYPKIELKRGTISESVDIDYNNPGRTYKSIDASLERVASRVKELEQEAANTEKDIVKLESMRNKPFDRAEELQRKLQRKQELEDLLGMNRTDAQAAAAVEQASEDEASEEVDAAGDREPDESDAIRVMQKTPGVPVLPEWCRSRMMMVETAFDHKESKQVYMVGRWLAAYLSERSTRRNRWKVVHAGSGKEIASFEDPADASLFVKTLEEKIPSELSRPELSDEAEEKIYRELREYKPTHLDPMSIFQSTLEDLRAKWREQRGLNAPPQENRLGPEAGSAPMLVDLAQWLANRFGSDAPKANYTGLGAFSYGKAVAKNWLVRNLSVLEKVSPKAHEAAVRAASAKGQAAATLRAAIPPILDALKGSGHTWEELRLALIESRLRGIRQRWLNLADQAEAMTDEQTKQAFDDALASLVSEISGRAGLPKEAIQTAAALAEAQEWEGLRLFLADLFRDAASRVATVMEEDWFDEVRQDPKVQRALQIYKSTVEAAMAESHALNEGIFSDALGPLQTYYPLVPIGKEKPSAPLRRVPYHKPKNLANYFATGLSEAYDVGMEALRDRLTANILANDRAHLLGVLEQEGLVTPAVPGQRTWVGENGQEYLGVRVEIQPARTIIRETGEVVNIPPRMGIMPAQLYRELKPILESDNWSKADVIARILKAVNELSLVGPFDFVFHTANLMGTLVANTPFLEKSIRGGVLSLPVLKRFYAIVKAVSTDPTTEEAARDIIEMAKMGLVPDRYASVTFSKRLAEELGAKQKFTLGPILYGPRGLDIRARLLMYRLAKEINPDAGKREIREFVNQLGNYVFSLQGVIERALKSTFIAPFFTAGSSMIRNGLNAWLGTGPIPKKGPALRLYQLLVSGAIGTIALWVLVYNALTGKWPWEDRRARLLQIPVGGGSGPIDKYRHSTLGRLMWGAGNDVGYLNFGFFNPIVTRGARALGLQEAFNTQALGGNLDQALEAAVRGAINTFAHPALGPIPRATWTALSGTRPYLTGYRDITGSISPQFYRVIPRDTKPGRQTFGRMLLAGTSEVNPFYQSLAEATGLVGADRENRGNAYLRMILDLTAPGLVGEASKWEVRAETLRRQQQRFWGLRSGRVPDFSKASGF